MKKIKFFTGLLLLALIIGGAYYVLTNSEGLNFQASSHKVAEKVENNNSKNDKQIAYVEDNVLLYKAEGDAVYYTLPGEEEESELVEQEVYIPTGTKIRTEEGKALVVFLDDSLMSIDENSIVYIDFTEDDISVFQQVGNAWHRASDIVSGEESYTVAAPNAVATVRGTRFEFKVKEDGEVNVAVFDGVVKFDKHLDDVRSPVFTVEVKASEFVKARHDTQKPVIRKIAQTDIQGDWAQANLNLDHEWEKFKVESPEEDVVPHEVIEAIAENVNEDDDDDNAEEPEGVFQKASFELTVDEDGFIVNPEDWYEEVKTAETETDETSSSDMTLDEDGFIEEPELKIEVDEDGSVIEDQIKIQPITTEIELIKTDPTKIDEAETEIEYEPIYQIQPIYTVPIKIEEPISIEPVDEVPTIVEEPSWIKIEPVTTVDEEVPSWIKIEPVTVDVADDGDTTTKFDLTVEDATFEIELKTDSDTDTATYEVTTKDTDDDSSSTTSTTILRDTVTTDTTTDTTKDTSTTDRTTIYTDSTTTKDTSTDTSTSDSSTSDTTTTTLDRTTTYTETESTPTTTTTVTVPTTRTIDTSTSDTSTSTTTTKTTSDSTSTSTTPTTTVTKSLVSSLFTTLVAILFMF